jgi:hypothetical protein
MATWKETVMSASERLTITPRVVVGFFIAVAGVLLLGDRSGLIEADQFLRFWPVGIIAVGLLVMRQSSDRMGTTNGFVLTLIGGWLLVGSLGAMDLRPWEFVWPTILILVGTNLMMQTYRRSREPRGGDDAGRASLLSAMGGAVRRWDASPFRGADMTAVMGGCELDLRQATLASGEEAVVDLFAVMGGHQIRVPETWAVVTKAVPIMGGIDDRTRPPQTPDAPRLVLRGFIMMGGVEIKS